MKWWIYFPRFTWTLMFDAQHFLSWFKVHYCFVILFRNREEYKFLKERIILPMIMIMVTEFVVSRGLLSYFDLLTIKRRIIYMWFCVSVFKVYKITRNILYKRIMKLNRYAHVIKLCIYIYIVIQCVNTLKTFVYNKGTVHLKKINGWLKMKSTNKYYQWVKSFLKYVWELSRQFSDHQMLLWLNSQDYQCNKHPQHTTLLCVHFAYPQA